MILEKYSSKKSFTTIPTSVGCLASHSHPSPPEKKLWLWGIEAIDTIDAIDAIEGVEEIV